MRRHSLVGPVLLVLIGALFLWNNMRPDLPLLEIMSVYWPFLLIGWGLLRLIEVLISYGRRTPIPRGLTGGEVVLIVFICLIGSGMYSARTHGLRIGIHGLDVFGQEYDYPVNAQAPVGNAQRVVFETMRGNLRVTGSDGQEIKVTGQKVVRAYGKADADQADKATPIELVPQGDQIFVRTNQDKVSGNKRVSEDLEITIPRSMSLEAHNRIGDLDVTDLGGNVVFSAERADVRLNKVGGNARLDLNRSDLIRAVEVKGGVEMQGRGSDIELRNIAGQVIINGSYSGTLEFKNLAKPLQFQSQNTELHVEALPGELSMDLGDLTAKNVVGPIRLTTKSKDVKIVDFTHSLELETVRGDIELQPGHLPLSKIDARSRAGRIDLILPEKATFQLKAKADRGDALNDYGPAIKKEITDHAASLNGTVGDGPPITLVTERGTVTVRKAGAPQLDEAKF